MNNPNELDKSIIEPETIEPETIKPEAIEPETIEPETIKPETVNLSVGKTFQNWELCEAFLCEWAKKQGFRIIKDRVYREEASKKINCPFLVNISCPKNKNPEELVFVNKVVENHNHVLNRELIEFEESKKFTKEMIDDIRFMTVSCKFGATSQRSDDSLVDIPQVTLKQMFEFVGSYNIKEIWAVSIGNSSNIKHYIILLQNRGHICTCLSIIRSGVVCRHYFQVMLTTKTACFHIRLILTRWYYENLNGSEEPFLQADKFMQENKVPYLCSFNQNCKDFREESLTVLQQKIVYRKVHSAYKKALNKALQTHSKSIQFITLLQEFVDESTSEQSDSDKSLQNDSSSEKNNLAILQLKNPKNVKEGDDQ
ncbi:16316_t:CDS:2 [Cetraspora pellucida]|uniref:16316_t:CDS:1 n=1 Tax=Cetraspora pellucida TaxID=1433469 RepID=A0ACA9L1V7_9GLOM|nr:16316_t:CDS:2 [Cetraspora pellucida]